MLNNIENFKKVKYYQGKRELTEEEVKDLGMTSPDYMSLDECAYQTAYDLSEDWSKKLNWDLVQEAYKKGVEDGLKYIKRIVDSMWCTDELGDLHKAGFLGAQELLTKILNKQLKEN